MIAMVIMWKYIDKRSAAIAVIRDFENMQFILENTPDYLPDDDIMKNRYIQAQDYMDWFLPAWDRLNEEDRLILELFYGSKNTYKSSIVHQLADQLYIEPTTVYKRKNRAIDKLTILLFGEK